MVKEEKKSKFIERRYLQICKCGRIDYMKVTQMVCDKCLEAK